MKITEIKTYVIGTPPPHYGGQNWVILKLTTDEGIEGLGEASCIARKEKMVVKIIEEMGEYCVIGSDPFRIERLYKELLTAEYGYGHPDLMMFAAISAFEMACWDIVGKAVNQPIYNLLGGEYHEKIRTYSYMYGWMKRVYGIEPGDSGPEVAAEDALRYLEQGFTAIGFDPALPVDPRPRNLSLETLDYAEAVVKAIREAVGSRCDILVKTHGQMTTQSAIRLAKRLEQYDPLWFEEPVPPENVREMARVAQATSIPIATGERLSTKFEFLPLMEQQAAQIIQPCIGVVGGILEAKKIAGMAECHYAQIAPHMYTGPIAGAAAIQLDVCTPNFLIQEGIETWGEFYAEILKEPFCWEKGYIIPSAKPGLGVELNEEVAEKHPYVPY